MGLSIFGCRTPYDFGRFRGDATGRAKPLDRDLEWLEIQLGRGDMSPETAVEFAEGMKDGYEASEWAWADEAKS